MAEHGFSLWYKSHFYRVAQADTLTSLKWQTGYPTKSVIPKIHIYSFWCISSNQLQDKYDKSSSLICYNHNIWGMHLLCKIGYPSETHLKLKSRKISIVRDIRLNNSISLEFCTERGSITAVLFTKRRDVWMTETNAVDGYPILHSIPGYRQLCTIYNWNSLCVDVSLAWMDNRPKSKGSSAMSHFAVTCHKSWNAMPKRTRISGLRVLLQCACYLRSCSI